MLCICHVSEMLLVTVVFAIIFQHQAAHVSDPLYRSCCDRALIIRLCDCCSLLSVPPEGSSISRKTFQRRAV